VREQLDCLPGPIPSGIRHVAVEGIVVGSDGMSFSI